MDHKKTLFFSLIAILLFQLDLNAQIKIEIVNGNSLSFAPTNRLHKVKDSVNKVMEKQKYNIDKKIALTLFKALSNKDLDSIKFAGNLYTNNKGGLLSSVLSWMCKCITINKKDLKNELTDPLTEYMFYYFTDNDYYELKKYLIIEYDLDNLGTKKKLDDKFFSHELLVQNDHPDREKRELTTESMSYIPLKVGDKVIDMGCGMGYYSVRLSKIVGEEGIVFATDIAKEFIDHLNKVIERIGIKNIVPVFTNPTRIGVSDSVNVVFVSSIWDEFYMFYDQDQRTELLNSIKQILKTDGYLIIMDFKPDNKNRVQSVYLDPRMIIAQLAYWGFGYIDYKEFSDNYVMIFKHTKREPQEHTLAPFMTEKPTAQSFLINVNSKKSLFLVGNSLQSMNVTSEEGRVAAQLLYEFFKTGDTTAAKKALEMCEMIIPHENFGAEYGAIQWLCEVQSDRDGKGIQMLKNNPMAYSFYTTMTNNNNSLTKSFLEQKYNLFPEGKRQVPDSALNNKVKDKTDMAFLNDYILNLNPQRDDFEKTSSILKAMKIQKGQVIADIGCGAGYFTYKLSGLVGEKGKVYAIEENKGLVNTLNSFVKEQGINNIEILKGAFNSFSLNEKADIIFMSSLYHDLYSSYNVNNMEKFVKCIKENLKPDGKLVIVDNGPTVDGVIPDYGSYIAKELIIYQLAFYSFKLLNEIQIIPQRYMLTFKLN